MIKIVDKYSGSVIYEADFSNLAKVLTTAVLKKVFFTSARLKEVNLDGADLREGKFNRANFKDSSLEGVDARHAVFDQACLKRTNFRSANLSSATFRGANLEGAIMDGADLTGTDFEGACLEWVSFTGAVIDQTNFKGANLGGTKLEADQDKYIVNHERPLFQSPIVPDRSHGRYKKLVEDFKQRKWDGPPLVVQQQRLLCGTHRFNAAKEAGWSSDDIPVIELAEVFREAGLDMDKIYRAYDYPIVATIRWNTFLNELSLDIRRKYDLYKDIKMNGNFLDVADQHKDEDHERKLIPPHEITDKNKYERIKTSLTTDGWTGGPLVVHQDILLSGSHRYQAAKDLGWSNNDIPVIELWDVFQEAGLNFYELHKKRGKPQVRNDAPWNSFMTVDLPYSMRLKYGLKLTAEEKNKLRAQGEDP